MIEAQTSEAQALHVAEVIVAEEAARVRFDQAVSDINGVYAVLPESETTNLASVAAVKTNGTADKPISGTPFGPALL